jgi:hypothetical protein
MLATATFASTTPTMSSSDFLPSSDDPVDDDNQNTSSATNSHNKGVAGRINYAEWDKVASHLVESLEQEDEQEKQQEAAMVRLHRANFR